MSIGVTLEELADEMQRYGPTAFVLTTNDDGRAHISHVAVTHEQGALWCTVGGRSTANAVARSGIAILWPPPTADGFSLIVDADVAVDGDRLRLTPTRAVKHRPAPLQ
jgi:hypothetical protein